MSRARLIIKGMRQGLITESEAIIELAALTGYDARCDMGECPHEERFWIHDRLDIDTSKFPLGEATVGIVDEEAGGIIAYCHRDNAARILSAFAQEATGRRA